ncbi:hypothetical protein CK203_035403 [Vitis vinifera]|uniref:Uncharacterized protein n=1 Tax=Vitis vinifera TaxID=29760 RepID=A0A438I3R3_VITVI|nr:hypothetical protein CK203_035403 [Vitis vinifera]
MTKYGMASSQVSSVTSPESGGRSEIPNLGGSDSSPILITGHKLNGHNYLQMVTICVAVHFAVKERMSTSLEKQPCQNYRTGFQEVED